MASTYTMVAYGSQGSAVRQLQNELNKRGYSLDQDGIFGKKTRAAVRDYQKKNGLTMVDGIAGDETWGSLLSAPTAAEQAAQALGFPYHTGVIQSKDSFYGEIRPAQMPIADELTAKWKAWKAAGALTSEMETAALMIVAQVLHVRCGAVLNVLWNADNDDAPAIPPDATERGVKAAVEAIRVLIREDSKA